MWVYKYRRVIVSCIIWDLHLLPGHHYSYVNNAKLFGALNRWLSVPIQPLYPIEFKIYWYSLYLLHGYLTKVFPGTFGGSFFIYRKIVKKVQRVSIWLLLLYSFFWLLSNQLYSFLKLFRSACYSFIPFTDVISYICKCSKIVLFIFNILLSIFVSTELLSYFLWLCFIKVDSS